MVISPHFGIDSFSGGDDFGGRDVGESVDTNASGGMSNDGGGDESHTVYSWTKQNSLPSGSAMT
jgi:hypothetical protein